MRTLFGRDVGRAIGREFGRALVTLGSVATLLASTAFGREAQAKGLEDAKIETPEMSRVEWNKAWPRFRTDEYIETGVLLVGALAIVQFVKDPPSRWNGGVFIDQFGVDVMRAHNGDDRFRSQKISDGFYMGMAAIGLFADPLVALTVHTNPDVAAQLALMNLEAYAVTGFVQSVATRLVGRDRPFVRNCAPGEEGFPCKEGGKTIGFISGHTAIAATGAGLMCAHHRELPLYGGGIADASVCALATAASLATGLFRIAADKHYFSDVIIGFSLGFASGYFIPHYRHYLLPKHLPSSRLMGMQILPVPMISDTLLGMGAAAVF